MSMLRETCNIYIHSIEWDTKEMNLQQVHSFSRNLTLLSKPAAGSSIFTLHLHLVHRELTVDINSL